MQNIINDKAICELVLRRVIDDMDDDSISTEMREHVFRFRKAPKTVDEQTTLIGMFISAQRSRNHVYINPRISLYVYCHEDISSVKIEEVGAVGTESRKRLGYLRTDLICERLEELFNDYTSLGSMGKLECVRTTDIDITQNHHGRQLDFETFDLNKGV